MKQIPQYLVKQLPMWMCENKHFFNDSLNCPICAAPRIPADWSFYVHNILLPKLNPVEREQWLKYFTTIFSDGFESGDFSAWGGTKVFGGTISVVTEDKHHGTYSAKPNLTGTGNIWAVCYKTFTGVSTCYARWYLKLNNLPQSGATLYLGFLAYNSYANRKIRVGVYNDAGTLKWRMEYLSGGTYYTVTSTSGPTTGQWYCIELKCVSSSSVGEARMYVDGTEILTQTGLNNDANLVGYFEVGLSYESGGTATSGYIDCVVVADTYIGPEGVTVTRTVIDYLGNLDIKSRVASLYRIRIDYVALLDTRQSVSSLYRVFSENLGIIDKEIKTLNKNIIEHVALFDSKVKSLSRTITENIKLLDVKLKSLSKNIIDYLGLYGYRSGIGQTISRIVTEIVTISDNILKELPYRWRKIRGYFIEDYERLKKKRLLRLLRQYIIGDEEE